MTIEVAHVEEFIRRHPDKVVHQAEVIRRVRSLAERGRISQDSLRALAGDTFYQAFSEVYHTQ